MTFSLVQYADDSIFFGEACGLSRLFKEDSWLWGSGDNPFSVRLVYDLIMPRPEPGGVSVVVAMCSWSIIPLYAAWIWRRGRHLGREAQWRVPRRTDLSSKKVSIPSSLINSMPSPMSSPIAPSTIRFFSFSSLYYIHTQLSTLFDFLPFKPQPFLLHSCLFQLFRLKTYEVYPCLLLFSFLLIFSW